MCFQRCPSRRVDTDLGGTYAYLQGTETLKTWAVTMALTFRSCALPNFGVLGGAHISQFEEARWCDLGRRMLEIRAWPRMELASHAHAQIARLVIRDITSRRRPLPMKRRFVAAISAFVSLQRPLPHAPPTPRKCAKRHRELWATMATTRPYSQTAAYCATPVSSGQRAAFRRGPMTISDGHAWHGSTGS